MPNSPARTASLERPETGDRLCRLRRRAWRWFGIVFLTLAAALLGWGVFIEPDRLVVHEVAVAVAKGDPAIDGLRIAALADIHAGAPFIDEAKLDDVVDRINALRPDGIVLLGDYVIHDIVGGRFISPERAALRLGRLRAPLGVFAVLGNHDWWLDGPRIRRAFDANGILVLENRAVPIERGGGRFWLVGLADAATRIPDPGRALAKVPAGEPVVAITHNPDLFPGVPGRVGLTIAGHTHGGQVRIPFLGRPIIPSRFGQRYAAGLVVEEGRTLFVTTGLGTSILPIRLGVPPEIALVTIIE